MGDKSEETCRIFMSTNGPFCPDPLVQIGNQCGWRNHRWKLYISCQGRRYNKKKYSSGSLISSSCKTGKYVSYIVNAMAADGLATQWARASTAMILTYLSQNIPVSAPKLLKLDSAYSTPFYQTGLSLIPVWISNYIPSKIWVEITYPFQNFNGASVEVCEWMRYFIPHFIMDAVTCWRDNRGTQFTF